MPRQVDTRAAKLQQARDAERRQARVRTIVLGIGGLIVLALVAAIVWAVVEGAKDKDTNPALSTSTAAPSGLTDKGAILVGQAAAPVSVTIFFDYMCPGCGGFEAANGAELERLVTEGKAKLELRPISFLDRMSQGTQYSTRAGNALATVADGAPDKVLAMHSALYRVQPEENTPGLTDEQIAEAAKGAGVPDAVIARFAAGEFRTWLAKSTEEAFGSGIKGTPTVMINGTTFEGNVYSPGPLTQAIEAAAGQG